MITLNPINASNTTTPTTFDPPSTIQELMADLKQQVAFMESKAHDGMTPDEIANYNAVTMCDFRKLMGLLKDEDPARGIMIDAFNAYQGTLLSGDKDTIVKAGNAFIDAINGLIN